ncbi:phosphotransferase, partial [Sphingobium sp.]|uniref:phosphotransferase n=1 Tax=Sphingobium sp. TaxID=1912891 RepID=UPI002CE4AC9B
MPDIMTVPLTYADVDIPWVTEALCKSWPDVELARVERGPVFGFKQNKFRITVDYAAGGEGKPRSFIVKGNFPGENDPSTGSAWAMANELRSFRDIVPLIAAPAGPRWHHIDVMDDASAIIMEDLTPEGATFFDAYRTLDLGQAMAFMDAFARMYASSWNSAMFAEGGAMGPGTLSHENRRMVNDVYFPTFFARENWQAYVALPRGRALPKRFQDLGRAQEAWNRLWALLPQTAMVVIHGDEHLGNLYVTASGQPGLIDWVARPEHWPIGLSYFMLCALDIADRRTWERALLSHFLARLRAY